MGRDLFLGDCLVRATWNPFWAQVSFGASIRSSYQNWVKQRHSPGWSFGTICSRSFLVLREDSSASRACLLTWRPVRVTTAPGRPANLLAVLHSGLASLLILVWLRSTGSGLGFSRCRLGTSPAPAPQSDFVRGGPGLLRARKQKLPGSLRSRPGIRSLSLPLQPVG